MAVVDEDHDPVPGPLLQAILELGISSECLSKIEKTSRDYAKGARLRLNQGIPQQSMNIRLFCQRKIVEAGNVVRAVGKLDPEQPVEPARVIPLRDQKPNGGWGYFLIERGNTPPLSSPN